MSFCIEQNFAVVAFRLPTLIQDLKVVFRALHIGRAVPPVRPMGQSRFLEEDRLVVRMYLRNMNDDAYSSIDFFSIDFCG